MDPENTEAWEVFRLASSDPSGVGIPGIVKICEILEVEDIQECIFKVLRIIQVLDAASSKPPSPKGGPSFG